MRVISFLNLKGGVAKTTTTINTAAILERRGYHVLVVDADSQCNLTDFLCASKPALTLADALREWRNKDTAFMTIRETTLADVDIIPADDSLMALDLSRAAEDLELYCLANLEKTLRKHDLEYDFVLIDCPPAFNAASTAALLASNEVVIPIKLDAFSLRGMANLTRQIESMRKINSGLRLSGLLPTMYYKSDKIREAEKILRESGLPVFSHIRRTPKVDEMTFAGRPLIETSPTCAASRDYHRFVDELVKGGARNG